MLSTTLEVVRAALRADSTVPPAERIRLVALLRDGGEPKAPAVEKTNQPQLVRFREAARLIGHSVRTVHLYCDQGLLERRKWKGRTRAAGVTRESLDRLLEGRE